LNRGPLPPEDASLRMFLFYSLSVPDVFGVWTLPFAAIDVFCPDAHGCNSDVAKFVRLTLSSQLPRLRSSCSRVSDGRRLLAAPPHSSRDTLQLPMQERHAASTRYMLCDAECAASPSRLISCRQCSNCALKTLTARPAGTPARRRQHVASRSIRSDITLAVSALREAASSLSHSASNGSPSCLDQPNCRFG
jgi:hypothetical protein